MTNRSIVVCVGALALGTNLCSGFAHTAEWYAGEKAECYGIDDSLSAAVHALDTNGRSPLRSAGSTMYVSLGADDLKAASEPLGQSRLLKVLARSDAANMRRLFTDVAKYVRVPWFVNPTVSIFSAYTLQTGPGLVSGQLMNSLFALKDAYASDVKSIGELMAEGGAFYEHVSVKRRSQDGNFFAVVADEYRVLVGQERRTYVIHTCVFPADIAISAFELPVPSNPNWVNRILKKQEDGSWRMWDGKYNEFQGGPYQYIYQSGGYYYFEQPQMLNNVVVGNNLYRVGILGQGLEEMDAVDRPNGKWNRFNTVSVAK